MIVASIIVYLVIFVFFTIGVISFITIVTNKEPLEYTIFNNIECDDCYKETVITDNIRFSNLNSDIFDKNKAKLCAELIKMVYSQNEKVKGIVHVKDIYISTSSKNICSIFHDVNTIFVCFRGTLTIKEWLNNFNISQMSAKDKGYENIPSFMLENTDIKIHAGFMKIINETINEIYDVINKLLVLNSEFKICLCGHSLGGSLATILGCDLGFLGEDVSVYSYGSPKVGDINLVNFVKDYKINIWRIVNTEDMIAYTPVSVSSNTIRAREPYFYTHCGKEIAFTANKKSLMNNHSLQLYSMSIENL